MVFSKKFWEIFKYIYELRDIQNTVMTCRDKLDTIQQYIVFKVIQKIKRRICSKWLSTFSDIHYFQSINFYLLLLQIHDLEIW